MLVRSKSSGYSVVTQLQNQSPLHTVRNKDIAEILVQNGADVNSRDINVSMYGVVRNDWLKKMIAT